MQNLKFPIKIVFKVGTFANDFIATDHNDGIIAYVRQKMFKLKEDILIYTDDLQTDIMYRIRADRWLDFSAAYVITDKNDIELGKIARKGWASMWKARYEIIDQNQNLQFEVREESGFVRVMDSIMGQIPFLNLLTGYFFHPAYLVTDINDKVVMKLEKQSSLLGRKFEVTKLAEVDGDDDIRIILSLMMMILLERRRG